MFKKKTLLKIVLAILAVPALIATVFFAYAMMLSQAFTSGDIPHKSDEELIANFRSHRGEFTRLLQMINEDRDLKRVDYYWTSPENPRSIGITQNRIDEYRTLFRQACVPRGFSAFQSKDYIEFIASSLGLAVSGSSKGYLYAKEPPARLIDNLDNYRGQSSKMSPAFPVYRHIEGNWYLFFEAD